MMRQIKGLLETFSLQTCIIFFIILDIPILVWQMVNSLQLPTLSCEETLNATVYELDFPCVICGPVINCEGIFPQQKHANVASMDSGFKYIRSGPLPEFYYATNKSNNENVKFCVGMLWIDKIHITQFSDAYARQYMSFASGIRSVGYAIVKKMCWNRCFPGCRARMFLRLDVLNLPLMAETPDYNAFWNFSSPLLSPTLNWISELRVENVERNVYTPHPSAVSGSALRLVSIRGIRDFVKRQYTDKIVNMPRLVYLDLFRVGIKEFTSDSFTGCPYVEYLSLSMNFLNQIPTSIRRLKYLTSLIIESNFDNFTLTMDTLSYMNELRYLSFGGTCITRWEQKFPILPNLYNLTLSNCGLLNTGPTSLDFPALQFLFLNGNAGISIPPDAFSKLHKLKYIDLSSNNLSKWPTFPQNHFETIDLSNNNLTTLKNLGNTGVFVDYLDLSKNKISNWNDPGVFLSHEEKISHFILEHQIFKKFNKTNGHFKSSPRMSTPWVHTVNLSRNNIVSFSEPMLQSLNSLNAVDLGGNIIDCNNCNTPLLQNWIRRKGNTSILIFGTNSPLQCFLPNKLKGLFVQDVEFDQSLCRDPTIRLWLGLGLPLSILVSSILLLGYIYRTEMAYLIHLAKIRTISKEKQESNGCIYDAFICYRNILKYSLAIFCQNDHLLY